MNPLDKIRAVLAEEYCEKHGGGRGAFMDGWSSALTELSKLGGAEVENSGLTYHGVIELAETKRENAKLREALERGLDFIAQVKTQQKLWPAEIDDFEDAARQALSGREEGGGVHE